MVDMFIESELAKSLLIKAMLEVNNNSDEMYKHVSGLKSYIGKSGKFSAKEAVQLHGGMGVSEEMMIGHYLKKMISIDDQDNRNNLAYSGGCIVLHMAYR